MRAVRLLLIGMCLGACGVASAQDSQRPPLPSMSVSLGASLYPSEARKAKLQGRVLVEFSIDKKGRVDNETVLDAEPAGQFEDAARGVVKSVRFSVPSNWRDLDGPEQRYKLSVLFKLSPCAEPDCTVPKAHEGADDFLIVGAQLN